MEFAMWFNDGFDHLSLKVFGYLDYKSLMQARLTCKNWYELIEASPKLWKIVLLTLRRRYLLINPFWKEMQSKIEVKNHIGLCKQLMHYQWELFKNANDCCGLSLFEANEQHCICIIYGDLKRLKFFWPYIKDLRHPEQIMHFAAYFGLQDVLDFLVQELRQKREYFKGRVRCPNEHTPLHIAAIEGHADVVKTLLPSYATDPMANGKTSMDCALKGGYIQIANKIEKWFSTTRTTRSVSKRAKLN